MLNVSHIQKMVVIIKSYAMDGASLIIVAFIQMNWLPKLVIQLNL